MTVTLTYTTIDDVEVEQDFDVGVESIDLSELRIKNIDLYPLFQCKNLQNLKLDKNYLKEIDITPFIGRTFIILHLLHMKQINWMNVKPYSWCIRKAAFSSDKIEYRRPPLIDSWELLHLIMDMTKQVIRSDRQIVNDVLYALGFGYLGFIDTDLRSTFLKIPPDTPIQEVQKKLLPLLLKLIVKQIDKSGLTTGLDLVKAIKHKEIAERGTEILRARDQEIKRVIIESEDNLRPLWITHYGYEILTSMKLTDVGSQRNGLPHYGHSFYNVRDAFRELGYELQLLNFRVTDTAYPVSMSKKLREFIWSLAEKY